MRPVTAALAALLAAAAPAAAETCGAADAACTLDGGTYHLALPEAAVPAPPVLLWLHGYAASGAAMMANAPLVAAVTGRGYAFLAPNGQPQDDRGTLDWGVTDGHPLPRDDVAFLAAVIDDAAARFGLDRDRVLAAGFSRGGSMVWDLACAAPGAARAFAAVAGGFWEPMATDCAGPVHLHHTHGFTDTVVPLEGRAATFGGLDFVQGNILKGLDTWRATNGCRGAARALDVAGPLWLKAWDDCARGSLTLRLHPGGHAVPEAWPALALDWFEALPASRP